jgi:hypothetical protein
MMRLSKIFFWLLVFFTTIWQAINFILSLTSRSKSTTLCNQMNPDQTTDNSNSTLTLGGYSTTFLGMQYGNTYGLANCDQAVQADVIGNAIMLFAGQILLVSLFFTQLFKDEGDIKVSFWDSFMQQL